MLELVLGPSKAHYGAEITWALCHIARIAAYRRVSPRLAEALFQIINGPISEVNRSRHSRPSHRHISFPRAYYALLLHSSSVRLQVPSEI